MPEKIGLPKHWNITEFNDKEKVMKFTIANANIGSEITTGIDKLTGVYKIILKEPGKDQEIKSVVVAKDRNNAIVTNDILSSMYCVAEVANAKIMDKSLAQPKAFEREYRRCFVKEEAKKFEGLTHLQSILLEGQQFLNQIEECSKSAEIGSEEKLRCPSPGETRAFYRKIDDINTYSVLKGIKTGEPGAEGSSMAQKMIRPFNSDIVKAYLKDEDIQIGINILQDMMIEANTKLQEIGLTEEESVKEEFQKESGKVKRSQLKYPRSMPGLVEKEIQVSPQDAQKLMCLDGMFKKLGIVTKNYKEHVGRNLLFATGFSATKKSEEQDEMLDKMEMEAMQPPSHAQIQGVGKHLSIFNPILLKEETASGTSKKVIIDPEEAIVNCNRRGEARTIAQALSGMRAGADVAKTTSMLDDIYDSYFAAHPDKVNEIKGKFVTAQGTTKTGVDALKDKMNMFVEGLLQFPIPNFKSIMQKQISQNILDSGEKEIKKEPILIK